MHEMLASLSESQQAPYSPPYVRFDSTRTKSDLWRAIPVDKQMLFQRKGGLSDVKPVATDGTHFLAFDTHTGAELVGHCTNLIQPEKLVFFNKKPKAERKKKITISEEILCQL